MKGFRKFYKPAGEGGGAPIGLSSLMSRGSIHYDERTSGGGNGGATISLEPVGDLTSADGIKREMGTLSGLLRDMIARGVIVYDKDNKPTIRNIDEYMEFRKNDEEILKRLQAHEDAIKVATTTNRFGGGQSDASIVNLASMILSVPEDMAGADRTIFNIMALHPEELAGLCQVGARHAIPGLAPSIRDFGNDPSNASHIRNHKRLHELNDRILFMLEWRWRDGKSQWAKRHQGNREMAARSLPDWPEYERLLLETLKAAGDTRAMDTATGSKGGSLVPFALSGSFQEKMELATRVAALFGQFNMPSKTFDWPVVSGHITAYKVAEATTDHTTYVAGIPATNPTWGLPRWTAQGLKALCFVSTEAEEDVIIPALPFLEGDMAIALARGLENALINGELDANLMDGATFNPTGSQRQLFSGLRYYALMTGSYPAQVDAGNLDVSVAMLIKAQSLMGAWGVRPEDFVWITGFIGYHSARLIANYQTMDKIGDRASIVRGMVGQLEGSPLVLSDQLPALKTTGKYGDGLSLTQGTILGVDRSRALVGTRRAVTIDISEHVAFRNDQDAVRGTWRGDFEFIDTPSSTATPVSIIFNIKPPA